MNSLSINKRPLVSVLAVVSGGLAVLGSTGAARAQPGIVNLGVLPGGSVSYANGVSADGSAVAGTSDSAGYERAFRWNRQLGMVDLGIRPGNFYSRGLAISGDGAGIAGISGGFPCDDPDVGCWGPADVPVRWMAGDGIRVLGPQLGAGTMIPAAAWPSGISHDGASVAISSYSCTDTDCASAAYLWTDVAGLQTLASDDTYFGERPLTVAAAINYDGSVIAGAALGRAFRWTQSDGIVDLGVLPGATYSWGVAISGDGSAVAGYGSSDPWRDGDGDRAFRWTATGGMQDLGVVPNDLGARANAISGDGSVVAGRGWNGAQTHAILWTAASGTVDLHSYLTSLGLDLSGWVLSSANGIDYDGSVIVGNGSFNGQARGWLVTIPRCGSPDFNHDGVAGTDADIEAFFACLAGACCATCGGADFNQDGDSGTDADIEAFFRVLAGGSC